MSAKQPQEIIEEIKRFRGYFPRTISVHALRTEEGNIHAEVTSLPGVITQAADFNELVEMVNDAVQTYFEVPEAYIAFMPTYSPPIALAVDLDFMPGNIQLSLSSLSEAASD